MINRYIPENSKEILQEETNHAVYLYKDYRDKLSAIAYGGKRKKPDFHYSFKNEKHRNEYVEKYLQERLEIKESKDRAKADRKKLQEEEFKDIKVGDIFHCGWGYEQTQCDFYKLIELKGKTGTFIEIGSNTVEGSEGLDCDRRTADPSREFGEPFKKRLNGNSFKLSSFEYVSKVADPVNDSFYCSWYY